MTALPPDDLDMAEMDAKMLYWKALAIVKLPDLIWKIARIYAVPAAHLIFERDQETQELK